MSKIDPKELRSAFGSFLTGVTVVTTRDTSGALHGFTANSFSSVSLDPPLLLVCPGRFLSSFDAFESCQKFAISILAEGQEDVSNIFATYDGDRFEQIAWNADTQDIPVMDGAAATFSCKTAQVIPAGDHIILLGEVVDFHATQQRGLGYAAGQYFSLGLEREAATASSPKPGHTMLAGAIIEHEGKVLLEQTSDGWRPPQVRLEGRTQVRKTLADYYISAGLDIGLGKAFSIFDDRNAEVHYTYFHAAAKNDNTSTLGSYVPIAELANLIFASEAHASMLTRYALEYDTQNFALYVGDESHGDILDIANRS